MTYLVLQKSGPLNSSTEDPYSRSLRIEVSHTCDQWNKSQSPEKDRQIANKASELTKQLDTLCQNLRDQKYASANIIFKEIEEDSNKLKKVIEFFNNTYPKQGTVEFHPVKPPVVPKIGFLDILYCIFFSCIFFWCGCCQKDDAVDEPRAALPQRTTPPAKAINPQGVAQQPSAAQTAQVAAVPQPLVVTETERQNSP